MVLCQLVIQKNVFTVIHTTMSFNCIYLVIIIVLLYCMYKASAAGPAPLPWQCKSAMYVSDVGETEVINCKQVERFGDIDYIVQPDLYGGSRQYFADTTYLPIGYGN